MILIAVLFIMNVVIKDKGSYLTASFSNNGIPPERPVTETGGLAVLRKTVEDSGGSMSIQSEPTFLLSISIPKNK